MPNDAIRLGLGPEAFAMNETNSLEQNLSSIATEIKASVPGIEGWPDSNLTYFLSRQIADNGSNLYRFKAQLFEDARFSRLKSGWIQSLGVGMAVGDHMLPLLLVSDTIKGEVPDRVISRYCAFGERRRSPVRCYFAVSSCTVSQAVQIQPHIRLLPFSDLPSSRAKDLFGGIRRNDRYHYDAFFPMINTSDCAIEIDPNYDLLLYENDNKAQDKNIDEIFSRNDLISHNIICCIFLQSLNPVDISGSWTEALDPAANRLLPSALSYRKALLDYSLLGVGSSGVNGDELAARYRQLARMESADQEVVRLAVDRLNSAARPGSLVDRALDLGIALEMLLSHGNKDKNIQELRFRLSLHGAKFLGGAEEEQRKILKFLMDIYALRSKAVHQGRLENKELEKHQNLIDIGIRISRDIIIKIIDRGDFPDWMNDCVI